MVSCPSGRGAHNIGACRSRGGLGGGGSYLRDTLAVLSAEEDGPGDAAGVLALEEERLGLSVLETEDLAVTADEELALY
jgi:hypothetical protein